MKHRILSLLICLCLFALLIPAAFASDDVVTVSVYAEVNYGNTNRFQSELNDLREEKGLPRVVNCYSLFKAAKQRAAEIFLHTSHERPDGSQWNTVWGPEEDCPLENEIIFLGVEDPSAALQLLMNQPEYAAMLMNENYAEMGIASVKLGDLDAWVLLMGRGNNHTNYSDYSSTRGERFEIPVLTSRLEAVETEIFAEAAPGMYTDFYLMYRNLSLGGDWYCPLVTPSAELCDANGFVLATIGSRRSGMTTVKGVFPEENILTTTLPVYEGQPDPVKLTIHIKGLEGEPKRPVYAPPTTATDNPYVHVHTPELANEIPGTCLVPGYSGDLACSLCGQVIEKGETVIVSHQWTPWNILSYPQWPAIDGMKERVCTVCNTREEVLLTTPEEPHEDGYAITVSHTEGGVARPCITSARAGHPVFISISSFDQKCMRNVTAVVESTGEELELQYYPIHRTSGVLGFTMPEGPVKIHVEFGPLTQYKVILDVGEGGTATATPDTVLTTQWTSLKVTPDKGYIIDSIQIASSGSYPTELSYHYNSTWDICMPDGDILISVRFLKVNNPFDDLNEKAFYYNPVLWASHYGITTGVDPTHFAPDQTCTRGQIVTFLWRAAGKPEPVSTFNPFVDVKEGTFYYKAVLWAVENGITTGVDATHFKPDDECTRAHVVTFLWRAVGSPVLDPAKRVNPFTDVPEQKWYTDAVLWAVEVGVTNGMDSTHFAPDGNCTRGQIVTFLQRSLS